MHTYRLPMAVVDAEYQFDRHKLTVYYNSSSRIDFRELVRDLFSAYKARIWMKKINPYQQANQQESDQFAATALATGLQFSPDTEPPPPSQSQHGNPQGAQYQQQQVKYGATHQHSARSPRMAHRQQQPQPQPQQVSHQYHQNAQSNNSTAYGGYHSQYVAPNVSSGNLGTVSETQPFDCYQSLLQSSSLRSGQSLGAVAPGHMLESDLTSQLGLVGSNGVSDGDGHHMNFVSQHERDLW